MNESELEELASEEGYAPGPASYALSRPAPWASVTSTLNLYGRIVAQVVERDRSWLRFWLGQSALGFAAIHKEGFEHVAVGMLLGATADATAVSPDEFARLLDAGRQAFAPPEPTRRSA